MSKARYADLLHGECLLSFSFGPPVNKGTNCDEGPSPSGTIHLGHQMIWTFNPCQTCPDLLEGPDAKRFCIPRQIPSCHNHTRYTHRHLTLGYCNLLQPENIILHYACTFQYQHDNYWCALTALLSFLLPWCDTEQWAGSRGKVCMKSDNMKICQHSWKAFRQRQSTELPAGLKKKKHAALLRPHCVSIAQGSRSLTGPGLVFSFQPRRMQGSRTDRAFLVPLFINWMEKCLAYFFSVLPAFRAEERLVPLAPPLIAASSGPARPRPRQGSLPLHGGSTIPPRQGWPLAPTLTQSSWGWLS